MTPEFSHSHPPAPRTPDVRALLDTLKVRRARTEADRQVSQRIYVAFERLGRQHDVSDLHFYVFEGAVSVYGDVLTHEQRDGVMQDLAALPGVRHVSDHLRVADRRPQRPFRIRPLAFESE